MTSGQALWARHATFLMDHRSCGRLCPVWRRAARREWLALLTAWALFLAVAALLARQRWGGLPAAASRVAAISQRAVADFTADVEAFLRAEGY